MTDNIVEELTRNVEELKGLLLAANREIQRMHQQVLLAKAAAKAAVEQVEGVDKVSAAEAIAQGFVMVRNIATGVAVVLIAMLVLISLFIITNTIKKKGT